MIFYKKSKINCCYKKSKCLFFVTLQPFKMFIIVNSEYFKRMIEVKVPSIGESVTYAELTNWLAENNSWVEKDQEIAELDSDKASFTISAEEAGLLKIIATPGKVNVGDVIAQIDTTAAHVKPEKQLPVLPKENLTEKTPENQVRNIADNNSEKELTEGFKAHISPLASKMISESGLDINEIINDKILRITKKDVLNYQERKNYPGISGFSREVSRKELSPLRKKLAERLVQAKNTTAMLTTYNEADMSRIMAIRKQFGEQFQQKYGLKLGFMSFFAKAVSVALNEFKSVNAAIEDDFVVFHDYVDLGIAVSTDKGLMVPVIKNSESLSIAELEKQINEMAEKARTRKITLEEMAGGTFTITNGGVFGSLFSSPIINPPQAAILGMHKIQERPVGINGKIELRPMMYLALSYDHRLIDGKESVTFLVRIKELIEEPCKMGMDCAGVDEKLLGLVNLL